MKNDHFQKQIKMLCEKNDQFYLKSKEYRFLSELFSLDQDISILNYFKNDIKDSEIEPWNSLC